ncbi:MAG: hypothetical protein JWN24_1411 [Phycisphaerales bacterium]|nr:hypothetical protein [Phycisphaerales bacterium]
MIAVRVWKRLDGLIPQMPELDPLLGKMVEIIALESPEEEAEAEAEQTAPEEPAVVRQRVRVAGVVERVADGGDGFRMLVAEGQVVPCTWASAGPSPVVGSVGRKILIDGHGVFEPGGLLVRVDAEAALPARAEDNCFAHIPQFTKPEPEPEPEPVALDILAAPAPAPIPAEAEAPRPALSAKTGFTEIFGPCVTADETA